jgi:mannose-6-phosphate isomerase-like protein (cupin superfamily)
MIDFQKLTTDIAALPTETFEWGTLTWLCNAKLSPGAMQTVGLCHIHPGRVNPVHFHPNCEEVLHVLAGTGQHSFDGESTELRAGMTIRIPSGVKHNLTNTGNVPITCLIAFNSGERETVFLNP